MRELRKYDIYNDMTLGEIGELLCASRFVWCPKAQPSLRESSLKILGMLIITPNEDQLEQYGKPMTVKVTEGTHILLLKGWIQSDNTGRWVGW